MRQIIRLSLALAIIGPAAGLIACSSSSSSGFTKTDSGFNPFTVDGGGKTGVDTGVVLPTGDTGVLTGHDAGLPPPDGSTHVTTTTTIYAHTDTELYSMDPSTHAITDLGTFTGMLGGSGDTVTDLAVDAAGDVYVNTETEIYKVTLPSSPGAGAAVQLASFAKFSATSGSSAAKLYALAFAPAGAIGVSTIPSGETLVGGDGDGELWVIKSDGTTIDVGNFGPDPNNTKNFLSLSGDLVFYTQNNQPTGLATIRSCSKTTGKSSSVTCTKTDDYLAGVNMTNLKSNATNNTSSGSLLAGIYGGTASADGNGTGKAEIFGLGAWGSDVYGFSRCFECWDGGTSVPAALLQIDTSSGMATAIGSTFPFSNGWSGAGVTTQVIVTVSAPPPTQPK